MIGQNIIAPNSISKQTLQSHTSSRPPTTNEEDPPRDEDMWTPIAKKPSIATRTPRSGNAVVDLLKEFNASSERAESLRLEAERERTKREDSRSELEKRKAELEIERLECEVSLKKIHNQHLHTSTTRIARTTRHFH